MGVVGGAVERVDEPGDGARVGGVPFARLVLLGEDGVVRVVAVDEAHDRVLGGDVGPRHDRRPFGLVLDLLRPPEALGEHGPAGAGRLDRHGEQIGRDADAGSAGHGSSRTWRTPATRLVILARASVRWT